MAITKTKDWSDSEGVNYDDMNANFDTLYNKFNTGLINTDIKSDAGVVESKIAFNTSSGHSHDGTDSKSIPNGYGFPIVGTLTTGTNLTNAHVVIGAQTITKAYAYTKTAPTGADLIIDINLNGTSIWNTTQANRLTIAAAATSGTQTSFDSTTLAESDVLTVDIDQVGSSVAGADLTIVLK